MNDWWMTDELTEHIWLLMLGLIVILSLFTALNVIIIERAISSWNICCCSCTALLFKPSSSILIYDRLIGDWEIADWCHLVTSAHIQSLRILLRFSRFSFVFSLRICERTFSIPSVAFFLSYHGRYCFAIGERTIPLKKRADSIASLSSRRWWERFRFMKKRPEKA